MYHGNSGTPGLLGIGPRTGGTMILFRAVIDDHGGEKWRHGVWYVIEIPCCLVQVNSMLCMREMLQNVHGSPHLVSWWYQC